MMTGLQVAGRVVALSMVLLLAACTQTRSPQVQGTPPQAVAASVPTFLPAAAGATVPLWATHYRVLEATPVADGYPLLTNAGDELVRLNKTQFCDAALQGTVSIQEGGVRRTYNYVGMGTEIQDCRWFISADRRHEPFAAALGKSRFMPTDAPFGLGVSNYHLVPYKTVAVDPRLIPYGSVLFIERAVGIPYSVDGVQYIHDGYFFAGDKGGAVTGNHIDVFTGVGNARAFDFVDIHVPASVTDSAEKARRREFNALIVDDPAIKTALRDLHRR